MLSNKGLCLYFHRTRQLKISQCLSVLAGSLLGSSHTTCGNCDGAGVLRTALWHWPGSRSLGFNCLHRLAYSKLGRSMLPGFHKRLSIIKHYLFTPQDQALSLGPGSFICIRRQRRERKDGGSSGCALWLDIAVMPQAVFPLVQCHSRISSPWDHYPH